MNLIQKIFYILLSYILIQCSCHAQLSYPNIPIQKMNGTPYKHAWAGGLNNPQFSAVDINGNGTKDLLIFDRDGDVPLTFLNGGTTNSIDYNFGGYPLAFPPWFRKQQLVLKKPCDKSYL